MYSDSHLQISLTGQKKEEIPSRLEIFYSFFETKSRKKNPNNTILLKKLIIKSLLHVICSLTYIQIILFVFILLKCSNPNQKNIINSNKTPVVFVPGYKGSNLKEVDKNSSTRVWLTPSQALGFSTPDLSLKNLNTISENGILESVTIPLLLSVKIYEPWINFLKNEDNIDPYFFSYDWRIDNGETAIKLEKYLIEVKQKTGKNPVVIGHSNGALLSLSVLHKNRDLFSKVVFAGAPFSGGVGFLEDLMEGVPTGLNNKIASPCVVQTFESIFTFFPRELSFDTREVLFDENKKPIETKFYSAIFWKNYNLGPYKIGSPCNNEPPEVLQKRLDKALKFRESLEAKKDLKYPPVLVIRAENNGTIRRIFGKEMKEGWKWKVIEGERTAGDGRVTIENALPPPGIPFSLYISKAVHSELLNDTETAKATINFIKN
jgi:pimeloyl-ACP methyl ester carboxylesterase